MENIYTSLNIGYWNIKKLISKQTDKSKDELFINSINRHDIIGLAEVNDINRTKMLTFYICWITIFHFIETKV